MKTSEEINKEKEAEEARRKRLLEEQEHIRASMRFAQNVALGDALQSGIPGGYDMDITTPL